MAPQYRDDYLVVDSPHEVAQWRPLANVFLSIPQLVIANALTNLSRIVFVFYWVNLVFTGNLNRGMYSMMAMSERYNERTTGFLLGWSESYPPFDFTPGALDNAAYPPVRLALPEPPQAAPKSAALNVFKAIPHYLVVVVFAVAAIAVGVAAWFVVLFTGSWPTGMRRFLIQVSNYYYRVWTYVAMVTTEYPKFGLA